MFLQQLRKTFVGNTLKTDSRSVFNTFRRLSCSDLVCWSSRKNYNFVVVSRFTLFTELNSLQGIKKSGVFSLIWRRRWLVLQEFEQIFENIYYFLNPVSTMHVQCTMILISSTTVKDLVFLLSRGGSSQ